MSLPLPPALGVHRLLSDGTGLALLRPDAEIDWWCLPDPDSRPVLWRLLDPDGSSARWCDAELVERGQEPAGPLHRTVLRQGGRRFECLDGLLADGDAPCSVVRLVRPLDAAMTARHELALSPFGGGELPKLTVEVDGRPATGDVVELALQPGQWQALVIGTGSLPAGSAEQLLSRLQESASRVAQRVDQARLPRTHPERARDALRVLDALTVSGAVLASATTSLPEAVPGDRCFDYRYCWLRDAALSVSVAALLGAHDSARDFLTFAQRQLGDDPLSAPPVATLRGETVPEERTVPGVRGWGDAGPVRTGNGARGQVQHDALGLFVEAVSVHVQTGGVLEPAVWTSVRRIADGLADVVLSGTMEPSSGVWELREPHLLVSEDVGRWIALDRALWIARGWRPWTRRRSWASARTRLEQRVLAHLGQDGNLPFAYDADLPGPDAAGLLLPLFGLARDERARALVRRTITTLGCGPYLRRYPPGPVEGQSWDGFRGREGAFLPVSFQAVAALAVVGEVEEATARLDTMCAALPRLLTEMVDPVDGTLLGNLPLLWSHMELVRALYVLDSEQRRRRYGTAGLWIWRVGRYLALRRTKG
ncbi:MAG: glycoside hydrolase family 15 protein [Mycobacteriales bacterium]